MYIRYIFHMNAPAKFVLYIRKGTDDDEKQLLSLEAQLTEVKRFADREGFRIVQIFQVSQTESEARSDSNGLFWPSFQGRSIQTTIQR